MALGIITSNGFSQVVINSGFENWYSTIQGWEDPNNWISSNSSALGGDSAVYKTSDSYSGNYAAKISTVTAGFTGQSFAGILVNGGINNDPISSIDDLIAAGTPISSTPSELLGFYKYTPIDIEDSAYVRVILKKYNPLTNQRDTIAWADEKLPAASSYTEFSISINELNPGVNPDSIVIIFFSKHPDKPFGGVLTIDDISLGYPTSTGENESSVMEIKILPNPTEGRFTVVRLAKEPLMVTIYSILGDLVLEMELKESTNQEINLSAYPAGVYYIQVYSGKNILTRKLIKQ